MNYFLPFIFSCIQISFQNNTFTNNIDSNIINYDCLPGPSQVCRLLNVTFKNVYETLTITSVAPENVFMIEIARSSISILTSSFCQSLPGTEIFKLRSVSLQKVNNDALFFCKNLSNFDVMGNHLRYLDKNTFRYNTQLEYLFLSTNNLRCVHVNLFKGLFILKELYLSYNKLRFLNAETFQGLKELRLLSLHSNQLLDFDILDVTRNIPKLTTIHVKYNEFKCSLLGKILKVLSERGIKYDKTLTNDDCLPDEECELINTCVMDLGEVSFINPVILPEKIISYLDSSSKKYGVFQNGILLNIFILFLLF